MSETPGTSPNKEKAAKVRRKPECESELQRTFAAARHNSASQQADESSDTGSFLQRQCACDAHTIGVGRMALAFLT